MTENNNPLIDYDYEQSAEEPIIKVVGVGGGGGNAVENMFSKQKVKDVAFLLCNTDKQALKRSTVPNQLILGPHVTLGLGAGNRPERAREAAEASENEIRQALKSGGTQMVFLTAGMGGGTGTGAAPVIGRLAMEEGLLTVGIVTIPFLFEGRKKILQALEGVREIRKNVDALLVVNNEKLRSIYSDLSLFNAFDRADETLLNAAKGISDMITSPGRINLDFEDVKTTLKDGGVAIISTGYGEGENRMQKALDQALCSPLLNNNNIYKARRILLNIYQSSEFPIGTSELDPIHDFYSKIETGFDNIWGACVDDTLGEKVAVTVLASGFDLDTTTDSITQGTGLEKSLVSTLTSNQEEITRVKQENDLIGSYYGSDSLARKIFKPVLLRMDELDDEDIIAIMEETPTLHRNNKPIEEVRSRRAGSRKEAMYRQPLTHPKSEPSSNTSNTGNGRTIKF